MTGTIEARSIDELLFHWPAVRRAASNTWAEGFAASIAKQSKRPRWNPTEKQAALMRRMVSELFSRPVHENPDEDVRLIE